MANERFPPEQPPAAARVRLAVVGLGNVGSGVLGILARSAGDLRRSHGLELAVTGVAELGGAAVDADGLDLAEVLETLRAGRPVAELPGTGQPWLSPVEMIEAARPDIVLEATPVDLSDGAPALDTVLAALGAGAHVVLANKGPLALAYRELAARADTGDRVRPADAPPRPRLRFSACVAGALPVIDIGRRDLAGSRILRFEGVLNGTSQSILRALERGKSFDAAVLDAQARGIAEADPALDVDVLDAACKLVIVANAVLGQPATLDDVTVHGIRDLSPDVVVGAARRGRRIVLLCLAELRRGRYRLSVTPTELPLEHPLARLSPDEMGVVYTSDTVGRISAASLEPDALPAAAAMLRDVLDIVRSEPTPPPWGGAFAPARLVPVKERLP